MKTTLLALLLLSSISAFADYDEDMMSNEITRLESQASNTKENVEQKKSFLQKLKAARKGYREWKEENPHHSELRKEMKVLRQKILKKNSAENLAIVKALNTCKTNPGICNLKGTLESIALNSDLPHLAKSHSLSIMPNAYAAGVRALTCGSFDTYDATTTYHLLLLGGSSDCGVNQYGPGLLGSMISSVAVCSGNPGIQAGIAAQVVALIGVGTSITLGQGGMCINLSFLMAGAGAFAGIQVIDFKNWD